MPVQFDLEQAPHPSGREEKARYYARVVNKGIVTTEQIVQEIEHDTSLTQGDVIATLRALNASLIKWLKNGQRVHIDGIGYFDVTLSCPKIQNPEKVRASDIGFKCINFRADKALKSGVAELVAKRSHAGKRSVSLSETEIEQLLATYFKENPILTRRDMERVCRMTTVTAGRWIKKLLTEGKLRNVNTKAQPVYMPAAGCFGL